MAQTTQRPHNVRLCARDNIPDGSALGFTVETGSGPRPIFVVRRGSQVHAYENSCPHTGVSLDWQPNKFLDISNTLIQCSTHGALFRIEDGFCIYGPCINRSLTAVPVEISGGDIHVEIDPPSVTQAKNVYNPS